MTGLELIPVGKNFSGNNVAGKRKASDFYETPYSMTQQFLDEERFDSNGTILEPACGGGAICSVLIKNGYRTVSYDKETDFLTEQRRFASIVTNPPFSLALDFIQKAKAVAADKFAFLLPLSYLHGKQRLDLVYADRAFPLKGIYVFCRYPMLGDPLRDDGKYRTGMMVYAWFVWAKSWTGEPVIRWLDNQRFILNRRDETVVPLCAASMN